MTSLIKNKKFLSIYGFWVLLHTFFLVSSDKFHSTAFWPFATSSYEESYDVSEWLVYVIGPIAIIFLIKSFTTDSEISSNGNV